MKRLTRELDIGPEGYTPKGHQTDNKKENNLFAKLRSWIKGKRKQIEMKNIEPDKNFSFEENYYGKIDLLEGFKIIYCNNYDKIFHSNKNELSFISCSITLPKNDKTINDLIEFFNIYIIYTDLSKHQSPLHVNLNNINYKNIHIITNKDKINIFLRGNLIFYNTLCNNIYNNIITKYIRNYLFPDGIPIDPPNEFVDCIYNSITNPFKDIDILFIEDKSICKNFSPVIGLSINNKYYDKINLNYENNDDIHYSLYNNRFIFYLSIDKLKENELQYLINNVNHGNKLLDLLHTGITEDNMNIDLDVDEIIE